MSSHRSMKFITATSFAAAVGLFLLVPSSVLRADEPPKKEERKKAPAKTEHAAPARSERPASTPAPARTERPARTESAPPVDRTRTRQADSAPINPRTTTVPDRRTNTVPDRTAPDRTRDSRPSNFENRNNVGNDRSRGPNPPARSNPNVVRSSSGRVESYRSNSGSEAKFRSDGRVASIRHNDMVITHGAGGSRRIVVERGDRVIVTSGNGHGYVQRPFAYRGTPLVTRTYYVRGVVYNSYYRPYSYRGLSLNVYVPVRTYNPVFYGFVYRPWVTPVRYSWGWYSTPWYGYYGGYFTPAPYYPTPSLWLADYIIAARLADAYQDQANARAQAAYNGPALSPAVKQDIAMEVQRQLEMERNESQAISRNSMPDPNASGLPRLLEDGLSHTFIVSYNMDVQDQNGQSCPLTRGDVMKLTAPPAPNAQSAYVQIVASKGGDCRMGSNVMVSLQDLQDTLNQMRESVNQGMGELQTNAGKNGMPAMPRGAEAPAQTASFVQSAPPPDQSIANELQQQVREADKVEADVVTEARQEDSSIGAQPPAGGPGPAPQGGPVTIGLGQTISQVVDAMGSPKQIVDLGPKQIYVYSNMKVIFMDGKVSDVQ